MNVSTWCNETEPHAQAFDDDFVYVREPAFIEVNKTVLDPVNETWINVPNANVSDIVRFNCTIHNSGEVNLSDIRFWDILDCSLEYADNATLKIPSHGIGEGEIVLSGDFVFKPKVLHPDNLSWDPYNPGSENFTELCPDVDHHRGIMGWGDTNNDNRVSACDQIYLSGFGVLSSYHVDNVPYTLLVNNTDTEEVMYIDSEQDYEAVNLSAPSGTEWNEVCCCKCRYHLENWTDDGDGNLSAGDNITLRNKKTGEVANYSVEEVTIDLRVSKEWKIDDFVEGQLTLEPCQSIIIEFNATVVKWGVDNNTQFAKGRYDAGPGDWVYDNDTATINVSCMVESATGTGIVRFESTAGNFCEGPNAIGASELPPGATPLPPLEFPHGFFDFKICGLVNGTTVNVTLTLPEPVPVGTQYWKYGPTPDTPVDHWYQIPIGDDNGDNVITIQITDGGLGDDDLTANGRIVDQGGPGNPIAANVPALTPIGIAALVGLLSVIAVLTIRKKRE